MYINQVLLFCLHFYPVYAHVPKWQIMNNFEQNTECVKIDLPRSFGGCFSPYSYDSIGVCMWNIISLLAICRNSPEWQKVIDVNSRNFYTTFWIPEWPPFMDTCFNVIDWIPCPLEFFRLHLVPLKLPMQPPSWMCYWNKWLKPSFKPDTRQCKTLIQLVNFM